MAKTKKTPAPPTRGVLLIAVGNPEYGRMAFNLLLSIRATEPDMAIALVHNHSSITHLNEQQQKLFTHLIECDASLLVHNNKPAYVKPKCWAYDLTPFDQTLFLDADTLLMPERRLSQLMDQLADVDFTIKNTGRYHIASNTHEGNEQYGYGGWENNNLPTLAALYGLEAGIFWQVQGEVFWFKKSKAAEKIFHQAKKAWTHQKAFLKGGFGGQTMNDELAFIIALAYVDYSLHQRPWVPTYWWLLEKGQLNRREVMDSFWLLSAGGNNVPEKIESFYNDIAKKAAFDTGARIWFKLKRKSTYLQERKLF
jgi:hypothetical protein